MRGAEDAEQTRSRALENLLHELEPPVISDKLQQKDCVFESVNEDHLFTEDEKVSIMMRKSKHPNRTLRPK